jgi:hypothetical protein
MNDEKIGKAPRYACWSVFLKRYAYFAGALSYISLSACGGNAGHPKIELNQHPKMHYAISVSIDNPPGPFDNIDAFADYGVTNNSCVPEQPFSGARILPSKRVSLMLRKTGNTTHESDMYLDLVQDEDYFSKGVCRWSLAAITVTAKRQKMAFIIPLSAKNFKSTGAVTRYFSYSSYADSGEAVRNMGNTNRNAYPEASRTFSITVATTGTPK